MKCEKCGTEYPDSERGCPACGYGALPKLTLAGVYGSISTAIGIDFGKALGSKVVGTDSRYMDDVQFTLKTRDEKWFVKPYPRTRNPLYVNGSPVSAETELADGDKLSLKGKACFIDVTYT